ncbi:MAG: hypothetical protein HFH79_11375 [Lachnospiraceae bacterium]|nr:hypothetical protein C804_04512 [Lachnospiraceae bacterium A4]MCI8974167.1 hypothetical protein [Lachnospiraceae bacterium]
MSFDTNHKKCFVRPPKFKNRMIMMLCGIMAQGLGLSLLRAVNLGTDPCSCLTQGVTNFVPLSFGTCQLLCHLVTFVFVLRYDLSMIGFGTIGNMCFLGYISDFFQWIWSLLLPAGFFQVVLNRYILLLPSLAVFLLGAAAYMCAGLGSSPYDALPFIISGHVRRFPFKIVRMLWDISFMAAGFVLGGDVGIVTILVAFFLGPIITGVQKKLEVLIA